MEALPIETRTLYAELLDRLRARQTTRAIADLPGSIVEKKVKGRRYLYFQHTDPGDRLRQTYLGPWSADLQAFAERFKARGAAGGGRDADERLAAQLRAGGSQAPDGPTARVLTAFSQAGTFDGPAVLVGTHAFLALGNAVGWRWSEGAGRTQDVDIAALEIAIPEAPASDVPKALERLEMGFLPIPALNHKSPSTSFMVRGGALRVDLVTPLVGPRKTEPRRIPSLAAWATPLPFLDYLLEAPIQAAIPTGSGILLTVPAPARFALHKLIVAAERPPAESAKASKDVLQAGMLAKALDAEGRRGDLLLAADALKSRGKGWLRRLRSGHRLLSRKDPAAAALLPT